jgi:putative ABC transport system permease protein
VSLADTLRFGLQALLGHRLRSLLTVLGILIGIAAVILTVGLGEGAQSSVASAINALGSNLLVVTPGSTTSADGVRGGFGSASTLTYADAQALASKEVAPDVSAVTPTSTEEMELTNGSTNWTTSVTGTTASYPVVRSRTVELGSFFASAQVRQGADVAVLGATTASELKASVGSTIDANGVPLTVIGVLASAGASGSTDEDDLVLIPITTAQQQIFGSDGVQDIYVSATSSGALSAAYQESDDELLALHKITNPAEADFTITPQATILATATSVDHTLTVLLAGIAAISLLVGGIGVMNIMLVSVAERVREIGLRKALGAPPRVIRTQFMVEASVLGLLGGLGGVSLGIVGAKVLPHFISNPITLSGTAIAGAIAVAIVIGLVFGVYPATRAARLSPIDALRNE